MAEWLDIPAHRILLVPREEFIRLYEELDGDGQVMSRVARVPGVAVEFFRRISDGR